MDEFVDLEHIKIDGSTYDLPVKCRAKIIRKSCNSALVVVICAEDDKQVLEDFFNKEVG